VEGRKEIWREQADRWWRLCAGVGCSYLAVVAYRDGRDAGAGRGYWLEALEESIGVVEAVVRCIGHGRWAGEDQV